MFLLDSRAFLWILDPNTAHFSHLAQNIIRTARARAFMNGRFNVSFEDVNAVALPVLRHRIIISFDAISEGITEDDIIRRYILGNTK